MILAIAVYDTVQNNRSRMTEKTLRSFAETVDFNKHRLYISDNGSCDATLELYERARDWLPFGVIYNGKNLGTAGAINEVWGLRDIGEHALKADNDIVVHQAGWVDWIEDVFDRDPSIGICGLKRKDLAESPYAAGDMESTVRMLPHEKGQRWLVVEEVKSVMGTCQGYSSSLLDKIGYLVQPGVYGFDDSLSAVRARLAGFKSVFLCNVEIDHIDPGGDSYCEWKRREAGRQFPAFNTEVILYESGVKDIYYDGGFDVD